MKKLVMLTLVFGLNLSAFSYGLVEDANCAGKFDSEQSKVVNNDSSDDNDDSSTNASDVTGL